MVKLNVELTPSEALIVTMALKLMSNTANDPKYKELYSPDAVKKLESTCDRVTELISAEAAKALVGKITGLSDLIDKKV